MGRTRILFLKVSDDFRLFLRRMVLRTLNPLVGKTELNGIAEEDLLPTKTKGFERQSKGETILRNGRRDRTIGLSRLPLSLEHPVSLSSKRLNPDHNTGPHYLW